MQYTSSPSRLPALPQSLPAFSYALAHHVPARKDARPALEHLRRIVQAYRVHDARMPLVIGDHASLDAEALAEAESGAHMVRHVIDRMQRLRGAYGEWQRFDAPAYFDLTREQSNLVIALAERVTAVHITFFADLLFPSFRAALRLWAGEGMATAQRVPVVEALERHGEQVLPELQRRWQHTCAIIEHTRRLLAADIGYLAANGADEERWRWQERTREQTSARRSSANLQTGLPPMERIPTLTLTMDFPLPAFRQPGRLRRLRYNRDLAARRKRRRR